MRLLLMFLPFTLVMPIFTSLQSSCAEPDWPKGCPHGETILPNFEDPDTPGAFFDFSEGELVYGEEGYKRGDIYLDKTFIAGNPALNVALHDAPADSLLYIKRAPSYDWVEPPDSKTPARIPVYRGHNVWVRTAEGHIAKFKILLAESNQDVSSFNWIKIQWIYQPDGSNEFHDVESPESSQGKTQ